jgi:signal transduction histidine kinase
MTRIVPIQMVGRGASKVERYLSISTDVTERKRLEARLRQQQRLESVGTLASGVAHEINNPVQGILNYAELIAECPNDPETVREFAGEIERESNRVAAIVRKLLAFSRQEPEQSFEHCTVRSVIDDTLALVHAVLRKDQITVDIDVPEGLPQIECRIQQIQQVIMNLVTNARDALNERYQPFDEAKRIAIRARAPTRDGRMWVRISVADRAGGIPKDVRARIFDPFFTTKGREQGTGLGLAVSHGIAVDHGGELSVESELGIGSTFHLDLPVGGS